MICSIEGCENGGKLKRGCCAKHYQRWREYGDPEFPCQRRTREIGPCKVLKCGKPVYARGFCTFHWGRDRHGVPLDAPTRGCGEAQSWSGMHQRLKALWGSADQYSCIECGQRAAEWAYDGTDPAHKLGMLTTGSVTRSSACYFSSWPEFYMPMCRRCHKRRDAAAAKFELQEYRHWKVRNPGISLSDLDEAVRILHAASE